MVSLAFPCFVANTDVAAWDEAYSGACSDIDDLMAVDKVCFQASNNRMKADGNLHNSITFHSNGDIETQPCVWDWGKDWDRGTCEEAHPGVRSGAEIDTKLDLTYMNQCSSPFSQQSILPFCSCSGFGGGGGMDGLMIFSLLMTIISTGSKVLKLKENIKKRHANIEDAYVRQRRSASEASAKNVTQKVPP